MPDPSSFDSPIGWNRRAFLRTVVYGMVLGPGLLRADCFDATPSAPATFVGKAANYGMDLVGLLRRGFHELAIEPGELKGKRILLKPNLVETSSGAPHINTHPLVLRAAIEALLGLGAASVMVAEGPGHRRDTLAVYEESGLAEVLTEDRITFHDLNYLTGYEMRNAGRQTSLRTLTFPALFKEVDWIVSVAKMKTHHWAGVTLSMKNLFGVMPGIYYGWPKNVLHHAGIENAILDITATLRPQFAIVDGIVGMEGDGPIMGDPKQAGVIVMGRNLPAVDATCCRIMGIDPHKIGYLDRADRWLGSIADTCIEQRGETTTSVRTDFRLIDEIPAQREIRLG